MVPAGSHRYQSQQAAHELLSEIASLCTGPGGETGPRVLHYVNCGLEHWVHKYRVLGSFADFWLGDPLRSIPLHFHLASRDAVRAGQQDTYTALYRQVVLYEEPEEVQDLIQRGLLERFEVVAQFCRSLLDN